MEYAKSIQCEYVLKIQAIAKNIAIKLLSAWCGKCVESGLIKEKLSLQIS